MQRVFPTKVRLACQVTRRPGAQSLGRESDNLMEIGQLRVPSPRAGGPFAILNVTPEFL